jgi:CBS domain-containing protein
MITAQDVLTTEIIKQDENDTFAHVMHVFNKAEAIVLTDHGKYHGMLLKRALLEPTVTLQTKLHTMLSHPPKLSPTTPLEEIARVMVENNIYYLPVLQDDTLLGMVTADDVTNKLTEQHIGTQPIKTIMCTTPLSVSPYDTIGKVIHVFREEHVHYLAVVDHTTVIGAIPIGTVITNILHLHGTTERHKDFESERRQQLDLPAKTIMLEQPVLLSPETTIRDAHNTMHTSDLPGVLIGKENHLHGIVTHKEFLSPYAGFDKEETIAVQFHPRNSKVKGFDKEQAVDFLREEFLKNYEKFLVTGYLHVSLEQHKEIKQGLYRVVCEMKLSGKPGVFYATHEGYGPMQAMRNAFLAIEHQINKAKKT